MNSGPLQDEGAGACDTPTPDSQPKWSDSSVDGSSDLIKKRVATLKAELALYHGVSLFELSDGSFIASKWNLTKHLASLEAVTAFARQMAGVSTR